MQGYKKPREMTWMVGASMLMITLTFCLSGYLLPWSQLSYWATTIVTNMPTAVPSAGEFLTVCLRGGEQVSGATLGRFFALHVGILPVLLLAFAGVHLFLIRRIGIAAPPFGRSGERPEPWTRFQHESHPGGQPFYPNFVLRETFVVMLSFTLLFVVIAIAPRCFCPRHGRSGDPIRRRSTSNPNGISRGVPDAPHHSEQVPRHQPADGDPGPVCVLAASGQVGRGQYLRRPALLTAFILSLIAGVILTLWGQYS
jgi:ubiquinol-cytochrome c reductase cytochrome b subunit